MLRRQNFGFDYRKYTVEDIVAVNLSCDSFFADLVAGGNNLFMCDRYLKHVSRRLANACDLTKVKLEVLEKEGVNLGRGRE
jgi:hypothetical protein